jgi:hypothetical protein
MELSMRPIVKIVFILALLISSTGRAQQQMNSVPTVTVTNPSGHHPVPCPSTTYDRMTMPQQFLPAIGWHAITIPARPGCPEHTGYCPDNLNDPNIAWIGRQWVAKICYQHPRTP